MKCLTIACAALATLGAETPPPDYSPWTSGPIIATSATNIPPGQLLIEPFVYVTDFYGTYNDKWHESDLSHSRYTINPALQIEFGLNTWIDFTMIPQFFYQTQDGKSATRLGDLFTQIGFQLSTDKKGTNTPDLRLTFNESFPTGEYQHGSPSKQGVDLVGSGSYQTGFTIVLRKQFWTWPNYPYKVALNSTATFLLSVKVEGINVYGGDPHKETKIPPAFVLDWNLSFELSLSQRWGVMLENIFDYTPDQAFIHKRHVAGTKKGSQMFSMAPEVEYNFNENANIVGGLWFSVAGKNLPAFVSFIMAASFTF